MKYQAVVGCGWQDHPCQGKVCQGGSGGVKELHAHAEHAMDISQEGSIAHGASTVWTW